MAPNTVIYAYLSGGSQQELIQQVEACQTYCWEIGLPILHIYQEIGRRREREKLLASVNQGEFTVLVLYTWDCLSGYKPKRERFLVELTSAGVAISVVEDPVERMLAFIQKTAKQVRIREFKKKQSVA